MLCSPPRTACASGSHILSCQKTYGRLAKSGARARGGREYYNAQQFSRFSFRNFAVCVFCVWSNQPRGQQPPPPTKAGPYKVVSVTPPHAISDAMFEAFRKQMNEAAQRKNRRALTKLVVGQGFSWLRENGDRADKSKSGVDNLAAALGLNNKDSAGWDMLASFADDPTGGPLPERNGALCDLPIPRSTARRSMT